MSKEFICKGCGEKFNKDMQSNNVGYCYICNEFYMKKYVADLEAKLAESEADKKALICDYESRITKEQELMSWLEHNNEELKQQLAEKDEQIRTKIGNMKTNDFIKMCLQCGFMVDAKEQANQDKISFAVEKLEKVKEWVDKEVDVEYTRYIQIIDYIDNQIKQLKEGK